jgi:hypothetical protein
MLSVNHYLQNFELNMLFIAFMLEESYREKCY